MSQEEFEKVQKSAARWYVNNVQVGTRRTIAGTKLMRNASTVRQRHLLLSCCQAYKIINHLCCLQFNDYLNFNSSLTRSHRFTLCCKIFRINSYRYSFFVNIRNTISFDLVNSSSYNSILYCVVFRFPCF